MKQEIKIPWAQFFAWLSGNILSKFQLKRLKTHLKWTQNVRFTKLNFFFEIQRKIYFGAFFQCNEMITQNMWSTKWRLILLKQ